MPEANKTYQYTVHRLDDDGKPTGFVEGFDTPKLMLGVTNEKEGIRDVELAIAGILGAKGLFVPGEKGKDINPVVSPFGGAAQQK